MSSGDLCTVMNARLVADPVAPRIHNPAITPMVEAIILRAVAHDDSRYPSAAAVRFELGALERGPVTGCAAA
jgi:hypothetical protein